jgi:mannose-6-phosphate isomerase class I
MAIALTPFEGLCGFRPKPEIVSFLNCKKYLSTNALGWGGGEKFSAILFIVYTVVKKS